MEDSSKVWRCKEVLCENKSMLTSAKINTSNNFSRQLENLVRRRPNKGSVGCGRDRFESIASPKDDLN